MTSGGCICLSGLRNEIDDLVAGAPGFGEKGGVFIPGLQGQPHIIKSVPNHVCGQKQNQGLDKKLYSKISFKTQ